MVTGSIPGVRTALRRTVRIVASVGGGEPPVSRSVASASMYVFMRSTDRVGVALIRRTVRRVSRAFGREAPVLSGLALASPHPRLDPRLDLSMNVLVAM